MVLIEGLVCVFGKTNPNLFALPLQYEHPEGQIFQESSAFAVAGCWLLWLSVFRVLN